MTFAPTPFVAVPAILTRARDVRTRNQSAATYQNTTAPNAAHRAALVAAAINNPRPKDWLSLLSALALMVVLLVTWLMRLSIRLALCGAVLARGHDPPIRDPRDAVIFLAEIAVIRV